MRAWWRRILLAGLCLALSPMPAAAGTLVVAEGVIRADERAELRAWTTAPVRRIEMKEGMVVRKGDLLVEMANDVERSLVKVASQEIRQSRAALTEAEIALEIASRELERNLKVQDLITVRELDSSRDAVRKGEALVNTRREALARDEAALQTAEANYEKTFVYAPFNGLVSRIHVRVGETVRASESPLLDLLSLERLYVEVPVPLPHLPQVRQGLTARVEVEHAAPKNTVLVGRVGYVYPEIDTRIRMFRVKVEVPRNGSSVLPGMFAKVLFDLP